VPFARFREDTNNTTSKGKLKTNPYNLYTKPGHYEAATRIAAFAGAKIFWVAVTVDAKAKTFRLTWKMSPNWLTQMYPNASYS
jgi:hypothetical protein